MLLRTTCIAITLSAASLSAPAAFLATRIPFDPSVGTLPKSFDGHDLVGLVRALRKVQSSPKGEFETTEAYEERRRQALEQIWGRSDSSRTLALVSRTSPYKPTEGIPYAKNSSYLLKASYNADKAIWAFSTALSHSVTCRDHWAEPSTRLFFHDITKEAGSYIGANAFGARAKVDSSTTDLVGIKVDTTHLRGQPSFQGGGRKERASFVIELPMAMDEAKKLKQTDLAALYLVDVKELRPTHCERSSSATYSNPNERSLEELTLPAHVIEFWVFKYSTGEVLSRTKYYKTPPAFATDPAPAEEKPANQ